MTNFSTKAYTLNVLISEVQSLDVVTVNNFRTFARAISPRAGVKSTKVKVLNYFLNGKLRSIVNNSFNGSDIKDRLLVALKARKNAR